MNIIDKTLYHQIHPFKIFTDVIAAFLGVYFLWQRQIVVGLVIAFIPPLAISFFMIRLMDFEKEKQSKLGKYVKRYMGRGADTARSLGLLVMLAGGWFQYLWLIAAGFLVIIGVWANGLVYKRHMPATEEKRRGKGRGRR